MRPRDGAVLVAWGSILAAVALLGVLVFGLNALPAGLLAGAGAGAAATGLLFGILGRWWPVRDARLSPRVAPESLGSVGIAFALGLLLTGLVGAGSIFSGVGAAALVLSVGALRQEGRR